MKKILIIATLTLLLCSLSLFAQQAMGEIHAYFYPHELTMEDKLVDGPTGREFRITDNTLLIWVDLLPTAFFAHPTAYILISGEETRVENGEWWPVLNGKRILFGERDKYAILSYFELYSLALHDDINIYIFPHVLTPEDKLMDGPGDPIDIKNNTLLVWVDLYPDMRFTHPTIYILISADGVRIVEGGWWPVLNGKPILYGSKNKLGVISPFLL